MRNIAVNLLNPINIEQLNNSGFGCVLSVSKFDDGSDDDRHRAVRL